MALTEQQKINAKRWRDANKEQRAAYHRQYAQKHSDRIRAAHKQYRKTHQSTPEAQEASRRASLRSYYVRTFGLTVEQISEMAVAQGGACKLCSIAFSDSEKKTKPHVDHDHVTRKIRGLLCHRCNVGLGQFKDNIDTLRAAVAYLEGQS